MVYSCSVTYVLINPRNRCRTVALTYHALIALSVARPNKKCSMAHSWAEAIQEKRIQIVLTHMFTLDYGNLKM